MLILNTKQDYQHFHQPTPLAPLLHNYRNAPIQPIPIPFLLLLPNSFLSINTTLLHPLYNKHSPHKPFTSTTISTPVARICSQSRITPSLHFPIPFHTTVRLHSAITNLQFCSHPSSTTNHAPSTSKPPAIPSRIHNHPLESILQQPSLNALHTHPIPLASIPNPLPSHSLSIQTNIPNRVLSSP